MSELGGLMIAAFVGGLPVALVMGGIMWARTSKLDREIEALREGHERDLAEIREALDQHVAVGHAGTEARAHAADQRAAEMIVRFDALNRTVDAMRIQLVRLETLLEQRDAR